MQNFFLEAVGFIATRYTKSYIYGCVAVGFIVSFLIYGSIGYAVGSVFDHGQAGAQLGCAIVFLWSAFTLHKVQDVADTQIQKLEDLKRLHF